MSVRTFTKFRIGCCVVNMQSWQSCRMRYCM